MIWYANLTKLNEYAAPPSMLKLVWPKINLVGFDRIEINLVEC